MTTVPNIPPQFLDDDGDPADSYQLFTYNAGTTTKVATYTDSALTVANTNPIILDSAGRATIFLDADLGTVKFVLATPTDTDPPGSPVWTRDNIVPVPLNTISTTLDRTTLGVSWTVASGIQTLNIGFLPQVVHCWYNGTTSSAGTVDIPAGTLATKGDTLIIEWEADYASAALDARCTMFGTNVDLGIAGAVASTGTVARYVATRVSNTTVDITQVVTQKIATNTSTEWAHQQIVSLNLTGTAYTVETTMASGTFTLRSSRIFYVPGFLDWGN